MVNVGKYSIHEWILWVGNLGLFKRLHYYPAIFGLQEPFWNQGRYMTQLGSNTLQVRVLYRQLEASSTEIAVVTATKKFLSFCDAD